MYIYLSGLILFDISKLHGNYALTVTLTYTFLTKAVQISLESSQFEIFAGYRFSDLNKIL